MKKMILLAFVLTGLISVKSGAMTLMEMSDDILENIISQTIPYPDNYAFKPIKPSDERLAYVNKLAYIKEIMPTILSIIQTNRRLRYFFKSDSIKRIFLCRGIDLDKALFYAAENKHSDLVAIILSLGTNPVYAFQSAIEQGKPEVIELLLSCGADPNARHNGQSSLLYALKTCINCYQIRIHQLYLLGGLQKSAILLKLQPSMDCLKLLLDAGGHFSISTKGLNSSDLHLIKYNLIGLSKGLNELLEYYGQNQFTQIFQRLDISVNNLKRNLEERLGHYEIYPGL